MLSTLDNTLFYFITDHPFIFKYSFFKNHLDNFQNLLRRFFFYFLILLTIGIRVCNFINFAKVGSSCILHTFMHICVLYIVFLNGRFVQNLSLFLFLKAFISPMYCDEFEVKKVKLLMRSLYNKSLIVYFFCKIKLLFIL